MKIVAICGSPRKGNSEFLARKFLESAESKGAKTELILLREKKIGECTGCDSCYGTQLDCVIEDDMEEILQKMIDADLIVFSTPVYFDNVSGIMKIFMDRTDPFCSPPKLKCKKAFIICVGDLPLGDSIKRCEENIKNFVAIHEMEYLDSFLASADQPNEISQKPKLIKKLQETAEKLVK
jgi:multimeric flavodoxin WrbA